MAGVTKGNVAPSCTGSSDDVFGIVCGDLGMGEGLKPGGIHPSLSSEPEVDDKNINSSSQFLCEIDINDSLNVGASASKNKCVHCSENLVCQTDCCCADQSSECLCSPSRKKTKSKTKCSENNPVNIRQSSKNSVDKQFEETNKEFPSYANVPLGTSFKQQKKLYEKNLGTLMKNHGQPAILMISDNDKTKQCDQSRSRTRSLSSTEIEKKLIEAVTEVGELKIEIETCRRRLDAKYRAIAILKKQAEEAIMTNEFTENKVQKTKEYNGILTKEVNKLNFELQWRESSFMDSQELWAQRFDRLCQENGVLMSTLESRSEELRRVNARNMALSRERDELLALMDVKEKLKYEKSKSQSSEDEYGTFSASELAVLGACRCRGNDPQPCGCAHAAASMKRDIFKLKEELDLQKQRTEETYLTVDAYRKAFEEQLHKNKVISLKLADLAVPAVSKTVKAKAAIKWLISVLNDEDLDMTPVDKTTPNSSRMYSEDLQDLKTKVMAPQELITLLTEMVTEKNEALAHQKLAAQVLAGKNRQQEEQLKMFKEEDVFK